MGFSLGSIGSGSFLGTLVGGGLGFAVGGPLGAGIGASLLGNAGANYDNNKAIDAQNAYNYQLWQLQNEYNTPANQVARLREAGLNPNLFYSQGNVGNATSAPDMKAHHYNVAQYLDLANMYYTVQNTKAQNDNILAQTDNIRAQTLSRNADTAYQWAVLDFYKKYGYFPNASIPAQVLGEIKNSPFVNRFAGAVGQAVGSAVGKLESNYIRPDFSPQAKGRDKARALVDKGFVYDRNLNEWVKW